MYFASALLIAAQTAPIHLQAENRVDPLGMDVTTPRLSWILPWAGAVQRAYQVRAASRRSLLDQGVADLWDSGRIESNRSINIPYQGVALHSRDRVVWQIRVWSDSRPGVPSAWS